MSLGSDTLRSPSLANLCGWVRLVAILVVARCLKARGFAARSRLSFIPTPSRRWKREWWR